MLELKILLGCLSFTHLSKLCLQDESYRDTHNHPFKVLTANK